MGCCCCGGEGRSSSNGAAAETELVDQQQAAAEQAALSIARGMSAPTIDLVDRRTATGHGLALVAVSIEQDQAYWEVEVLEVLSAAETDDNNDDGNMLLVGVASRKDRKFYQRLEAQDTAPTTTTTTDTESDTTEVEAKSASSSLSLLDDGTDWLRPCKVKKGDIVGVAVQQSDFPMVQLSVNGEIVASINRFQGTVHPAVRLPASSPPTNAAAATTTSCKVRFTFADMTHPPANHRWQVMVARGLV